MLLFMKFISQLSKKLPWFFYVYLFKDRNSIFASFNHYQIILSKFSVLAGPNYKYDMDLLKILYMIKYKIISMYLFS